MLSLILKDLRGITEYVAIMAACLGVLVLVSLMLGGLFVMASFGVTALIIAAPIQLEWGSGPRAFVHSLPVSRVDVVKASYGTSVALGIACLLLWGGIALAFGGIVVGRGSAWPAWISLGTGLAFVVTVGVYIALLKLCEFRFGSGVGGAVAALTAVVFAPVVLSARGLQTTGVVVDAVGSAGATVVAGVIVVLALWFSLRISVEAYERREF